MTQEKEHDGTQQAVSSKIGDYAESTEEFESSKNVEKYTALVVDKESADLGPETANIDKHQISELTDYVDDLIKNAFKQEPVNIDEKGQEPEDIGQ